MPISFGSIIMCEASLQTQVLLLVVHALIWHVFIQWSSKRVVEPFVKRQAWARRWTDLHRIHFEKFLVKFKTDQSVFEFACRFTAILFQHAVGGALILPSMLCGPGGLASAMACQAALCEAGFELQDLATMFCQCTCGGEDGRNKYPPKMVIMFGLHHFMALSMVIPMNILYHDSACYHEFVFLLQFASTVAAAFQSFGYTLDVKTEKGLAQMKISVACTWVTVFCSRLARYAVVGLRLVRQFYSDGNTNMLYIGSGALGFMSVMNLFMFFDCSRKFVKFLGMRHTSRVDGASVAKPTWQQRMPCLLNAPQNLLAKETDADDCSKKAT